MLQALRDNGRIADSTVVEKGGQQIGIIGVSPPETPTISSPRNVKFVADVAGIVNAEAQRLTDAGVNKIILSSHLQNTANERAVVDQLKNVDIVISGGADDLLANPGDRARPDPDRPAPVGPYPLVAQGQHRARTSRSSRPRASTATSAASRSTFDADGKLESHRHGEVGPGPRSPPTRRSRTTRAEDATLKARDHRPAGRLQGRRWRRT